MKSFPAECRVGNEQAATNDGPDSSLVLFGGLPVIGDLAPLLEQNAAWTLGFGAVDPQHVEVRVQYCGGPVTARLVARRSSVDVFKRGHECLVKNVDLYVCLADAN